MNVRLETLIAFACVLLIAALVWMLLPAGEIAPPDAPAAAPQPSAVRDHGDAAAQRIAVEAQPDAAALTLRGRVLDAYGEPVADALIGDAEAAAPVRTAVDGGFALRVDGGARAMTLLVLAAGHAPLLFGVEPGAAAGERDVGDVLLRHAGSIRGSVTASGGQPLPAAALTLRWQGAALPAGLDLDALLPVASSGADGSYAFANLMPGSYRVSAAAKGMQRGQSARLTVREGEECVAAPIALAVGCELRGLVLGPGDVPVAGAAVRIDDRGNPRFREAVTTDADGAFVAAAVPPGPLHVEVSKPGYLSSSRSDVDAARGERLVVHLEAGLGIRGIAVDARSGKPVQRFAVELRRLGDVAPASNGTMVQQLQRQIEASRAAASGDAAGEQLQVAAQLQARLAAVQQPVGPVPVPADLGPMLDRPEGRFACDGLEEGVYTVGIASPDHQYAESAPIELRRGRLAADLRIELSSGHRVTGTVVSRRTGAAIAGARVELLHPLAPAGDLGPTHYAWAFAPAAPAVAVMATDTGDDGRFAFAAVGAGAWRLTVRQAQIADHDSDVFYVQDGIDLRIAVDERASLFGRVHHARAMPAGIEVLVLGGHGTLRTTKAASDGSYRFDLLQPGSYLVRAFAADAGQYEQRLLGTVFGSGAGGDQPPFDLTLAPGESRGFDLDLDEPAAGAVAGSFAINGEPARGGRVVLQPVPGEAPGSGGLPLRGGCDDLGRFHLADVPAGNYTAHWFGATRQELHRQGVRVEPGANVELRIEAAAGGVRGRILAADAAPAELRGYVWVLPGAAAAPDDLYEYRREHRTHRIAVQAGAFEDAALTPGPAVVVADIRGRRRLSTTAVVPAGGVLLLELPMAVGGR